MPERIVITGATGYLGSAIAARLIRAGHEVGGLTRTREGAAFLQGLGAKPILGDLADWKELLGDFQNCDAVIHAAEDPGDAAGLDQSALEAVRAAAQDGRVRRLLYTSGIWVHGDTAGAVVDESAPLNPIERVKWRAAHEDVALDFAEFEVASIILRPALVYGGSRGILGAMFAEAKKERTVTYAGDGSQLQALVHVQDVAEAYALALEHGKGGDRFILCDESATTAKQIAEAIARVTGASAKSWAREEVLAKLGTYGEALLVSQRASSLKARRDLGWVPRHSSFTDEIDAMYREWLSGQKAPVG
jgi:nucleoside-diphosphate-sugar epimerase